ncbi:ABC transporter substrate-binding protein [Kineococcus terrestris]|uniref:ABC transporter substrate-binding protein n=1 Tax=Kineococcus terrestris TaxID=2044856 RepID=UPI0034DB6B39
MLSRRSLLLGSAALAGLTACGEQRATPPGAVAAAAGGFPRTVRHELGETEVPAAPQRVVCGTDGGELCSLLALGVRPVGFGQRNDPLRPWVRDLAAGVETYPLASGETNFERLAVWQPDLLLVQDGFATDETMPLYSAIAPTVATSFIDWRENLRQVAAAVGREERAQELLGERDAAVAALAAGMPAEARGLRVQALTAFPDGSVYLLNSDSPLGKAAAALGLAPLPAPDTAGEAVNLLSAENVPLADGDLLLLLNFGPETDGTPELKASDVFRSLEVVRAGGVVDVREDDSHRFYFDSVLTVEPNTRLLGEIVTAAVR